MAGYAGDVDTAVNGHTTWLDRAAGTLRRMASQDNRTREEQRQFLASADSYTRDAIRARSTSGRTYFARTGLWPTETDVPAVSLSK